MTSSDDAPDPVVTVNGSHPPARVAVAPLRHYADRPRRKTELAPPQQGFGAVTSAVSLGIRQARAAVEALAVVGLAAAVLSSAGVVVSANTPFHSLLPGTIRLVRGRPRVADPAACCLIDTTLAQFTSLDSNAALSLPLRAARGKLPAMLHLLPIPADSADLFTGLGAILIVTQPQPRPPVSLELLKGLFDLSPAEGRIAQGIAARMTVEAIADRSRVSRETVRSQLKSVLAKTGTKRQLDLALLLHDLRLPRV